MKRLFSIAITIFCFQIITAQKSLSSLRITDPIEVDGKLDEAIWSKAETATGFTNWQPIAGDKPSSTTEVKIMYDDKAVYIGAKMNVANREQIKTELAARDEIGNTDWFGFVLDTYGNGTDGLEFIVSATGVQFDAKLTTNGEDEAWNEVWFSEVSISDNAWYVEMRIPYSAIRFPNKKVQEWRFNLMRRMAGTGERTSYQYIDPQVNGFINQTAYLTDVSDIKSPIRLSLSPYITGYAQRNSSGGSSPETSTGYSYNGGLDLKYGINEAFTLDMTLIPDFGQVQSDDLVLNLSPFEVRYDENRAFFTEGLELFNKANIFYTRRVGGTPPGYWSAFGSTGNNEQVISNPSETQLYNASKVSGRTSSGLGVGVFNAIAGSSHAQVRNNDTDEIRVVETSPLTNYNVVVLDQNLKNNSSISLINSNVWRKGSTFYNANVTGLEFDLRNKAQSYGISGQASVSQKIYKESDNINGVNYDFSFSKIGGNMRFSLNTAGISGSYDNNDLGYNTETNIKRHNAGATYNFNQGWKFLDRGTLWFNTTASTTYDENKFSGVHFNSGFWARTKKQWTLNMWTNFNPGSKDFFEPRVAGRYMERPGFYNMGWYVGSDDRKKFRVGALVFGMKRFEDNASIAQFDISPRYRFSDKFTLFAGLEGTYTENTRGFVDFDNSDPIIGLRDQVVFNNVLGATYTFNSKMSFNIRARHYWSKVQYDSFHSLTETGGLGATEYNRFNDFTFNLLNVDMNYTWRFAPGSDLIFNWKSNVSGGEFSDLIDYDTKGYIDGVRSLSDLPSRNSVSIRLVYFLNAARFL